MNKQELERALRRAQEEKALLAQQLANAYAREELVRGAEKKVFTQGCQYVGRREKGKCLTPSVKAPRNKKSIVGAMQAAAWKFRASEGILIPE